MVECNRCHKELSIEEKDAGYNSDMYENKFCSICIKDTTPDKDIDDLSFESNEDDEKE